MKHNKILLFFLSLLIIGNSACYTDIEGCLDPLASNFNAEADENCCCTYPTISPRWEYKIKERIYTAEDSIESTAGYFFRVLDFKIIGGDVLIKGDTILGTGVEEQMLLNVDGALSNVKRIDDAFFLTPNRYSHSFGQYRYKGMVDSLIFHWAPIQRFGQIDTSSFENSSHPLRVAGQQGLWKNNDYCFASIEVAFDQDTMEQFIPFNESIRISKLYQVELAPFINRVDTLSLDLDILLREIDWKKASPVEIGRAMTNYANQAIKLRH